MRVKSAFKLFSKSPLVLTSGVVLLLVAVLLIASAFIKPSRQIVSSKQMNILVRQIGHHLLLQAGDSSSRVLPVVETSPGTFLLEFESEFVFSHDSLMKLTTVLLPKAQFPSGYMVTVHDCKRTDIVYGFQINHATPDILACQGRLEPMGCYTIEISFPNLYEENNFPLIGMFATGILLMGVALLIGRVSKTAKTSVPQDPPQELAPELVSLGKFLFDVKNQRLLTANETIALTDKECRVLELLSKSFGELITRETLMEKVWISEGVITGRSLDMFVSKLRKKLSGDPTLRITNIHGKGYKLEVVETPS